MKALEPVVPQTAPAPCLVLALAEPILLPGKLPSLFP